MTNTSIRYSQALEIVEKAICEGDYSQALASLREIDRRDISASDTTTKARVCCMHGKVLYELGQCKEALLKTKVAVRLAKRVANHFLLAEAKYLLGRILAKLGRLNDAAEQFNESYAIYRAFDDSESLFLPLNSLAQLHHISGNYRRCCEVLELSINCAAKYHTQRNIDIDKRNLARVLFCMGDFRKAESFLDSIMPDVTDQRGQANSSQIRGMISLMRLNFKEASDHINGALRLFKELDASRDQAVCFEFLGLLECWSCNYSKAREYYHKVLDMPEPTASAVAQTLRMLTDVCIAEGNFDEAMETAKKAEDAIVKINERIELGALYRAYGQIYTFRRKHQTACDYFNKSITLLKEIGAQYELALTYFVCGQSASYNYDESMGHLHTARTLFTEMGIPKRIEQVDQAITKLNDSSRHVPSIRTNRNDRNFPVIVTKDPVMLQILSDIDRVKNTNMTVLLTGETGTGKDLCAEYIHKTSTRSGGPFQIVNSAAIPESLLESELFGCRKGVYTGATRDKTGMIKSADGGTFYFDEIGEASLNVQTKLLRVLDTKKVCRLGDTSDTEVDVRFVAATNYDLLARVAEGLFRRDLYYRLRQMPIHLPALRDRKGDMELLVRFFLTEAGIAQPSHDDRELSKLDQSLCSHDWPGNVRELKFVIERLVALANKNEVAEIVKVYDREKSNIQGDASDLCHRERLVAALKRNNGNQSKAARELGIPESTFRYQLKKYNII